MSGSSSPSRSSILLSEDGIKDLYRLAKGIHSLEMPIVGDTLSFGI